MTAIRVRGIVPALFTVATYMTAFYGLYAYLGPHLTGVLRLSTSAAGLAPAAYGLGFGLATFVDRFLDRHGAAAAGPFVFLGLALVYSGLAAGAVNAGAIIAICLVLGVANHLGLNLIVGRLTALDPDQQGAIMGLYSTVKHLAPYADRLTIPATSDEGGKPSVPDLAEGSKNGHSEGRPRLQLVAGTDLSN